MANPILEYPALAAVAAVVREGSFDRAATALGITPSAVSQRVKAMEERVGAALILRTNPCLATVVGARLCTHFDRVRLLEDSIIDSLPNVFADMDVRTPTLPIAVNGDSLSTWFPQAAGLFAQRCHFALDLTLAGEETSADLIRNGRVLGAITSDAVAVQGCRAARLGILRYVAVASPCYFDRHFPHGIDVHALANAPVLRTDRDDALQSRWAGATVDAAIRPPTHLVPSTQGFVDLLRAGLGWGMVPQLLAERYIAAGELRPLEPARELTVTLYWQYSRLFAHILRELTRAITTTARAQLLQ